MGDDFEDEFVPLDDDFEDDFEHDFHDDFDDFDDDDDDNFGNCSIFDFLYGFQMPRGVKNC